MRPALAIALLCLAACSPSPPPDAPEPTPAASGLSAGDGGGATAGGSGSASASGALAARPPGAGCKLDAPKLSDDPCAKDDDCGVSAPCHAPACVAKAKADPPKPDTMCTTILLCDTADANRCGCHAGRCALIPPADK